MGVAVGYRNVKKYRESIYQMRLNYNPPSVPTNDISLAAQPGVLEQFFNRARTCNMAKAQQTPVGEWELSPAKTYRTLTVTAQGEYLHCKQHAHPGGDRQPAPSGARGKIQEFSGKSRKRLLDLFAKIDRKALRRSQRVLFVTLTYPYMMTDEKDAKKHLKAFMERIQYHHPTAWAVWRKEYQKSGSIHYHIMLGNVGYLAVNQPGRYDWQKAWGEVIGDTATNSLDVEKIKSPNGVMYYVSKYMSKEQKHQPLHSVVHGAQVGQASQAASSAQVANGLLGLSVFHRFGNPIESSQSPGRFWGVYGRKYIPLADETQQTIHLTESQYRAWLAVTDSEYCNMNSGWTVYSPQAVSLARWAIQTHENDPDKGWRQNHWNTLRTVTIQKTIPWQFLTPTQQKNHVMRQAQTWLHGADYDAPPRN